MTPVPILFVSDDPSQSSGLARIIRDLATLLSASPEFRVATLGWSGTGARSLPFMNYHMPDAEPVISLQSSLPHVSNDWFQGEPGIIFTIWDLSRLLWLAHPEYAPEHLRDWLGKLRARHRLWAYVPVDSTGPGNKLTAMSAATLVGFDRLLAYTPFGRDVILNTIGHEEAARRDLDWLPHGIGDVWRPDEHNTNSNSAVDSNAGIRSSRGCRIGVVATNQARKDWGLTVAVLAALRERMQASDSSLCVTIWLHIDTPLRFWSLEALLTDYNLSNVEVTTPPMSDSEMAERYRACDVTLHTGPEGFGYSIFESLACGVPAVHGDYAGGASIMHTLKLQDFLMPVSEWRLEGQHNSLRPVHDPVIWVECIEKILSHHRAGRWPNLHECVEHLKWSNLWPRWSHWFKDGLG